MNTFAYIDICISNLNHVSREFLDVIILSILSFINSPESHSGYFILQLAILLINSFFLVQIFTANWQRSLFAGLTIVCLLVSLCGAEIFFLKLHWLPLLISSLLCLRYSSSVIGLLLLFPSLFLWIATSGPLSIFGIIFSVVTTALINPARLQAFSIAKAKKDRFTSFIRYLGYLGIGVAILVAYYILPVYPMPDFPHYARLVPISIFSFQADPFIGPVHTMNTLVHSEVVRLSKMNVALLFSVYLACLITLFMQFRGVGERTLGGTVSFFIAFSIVLGSSGLSGSFSPMLYLRSIIPGIALNYFPWTISGAFILLSVVLFASSFSLRTWGGLCLLASAFALGNLSAVKYNEKYAKPELVDHFSLARRKVLSPDLQSLQYGPSSYIYNNVGKSVINRTTASLYVEKLIKRLPLTEVKSSSIPPETNSEFAIDGDLKTRWSTGRPQSNGDQLLLEFPTPVHLQAANLRSLQSTADFPRGLGVYISEDGVDYLTVLEQKDWQGEVRWSKDGSPYFGPQSSVVVYLPKEKAVKYLKFVQLSEDKLFNWSIDEVELYGKLLSSEE